MLKNFLKIAWRNLTKNRVFSLLNIAGLAIGLSCFLMISLYVVDELSFDKHFANSNRIYRINSDIRFGGTDLKMPVSSDMTGQVLKKDFPEVEQYTRIFNSEGSKLIKKGNEFINENDVAHADSTFFEVFNLPAIAGDLKTALNEPNTVVLTASAAKKYFGTVDVIGKMIQTGEEERDIYKITAVINDIPRNTHFHLDFIFSMDNVNYGFGNYLSHNFHTYLLLKKGVDANTFSKKAFDTYITNYVIPQASQVMQIKSMDDFEKAGNKLEYSLIGVKDIHLKSDRSFELSAGGNIQYVYIFSAVALFILLIACINFMNLTTARSITRAREVGIRKVLGTEKGKLVFQFLSESTLMVLIALVVAIGIVFLAMPAFNDIASKNMTGRDMFSPAILPVLIALPILVGLLAGSYPAFYLSSFRPIEVLKGKLRASSGGTRIRSVLVVFQFVASIILIIGTIIVYRQIHFIHTSNLGFNKDQVLIINGTFSLGNNADAFKNEMLKVPGVKTASFSGYLPVPSARNDNSFSTESVMNEKNGFNMQVWRVDHEYRETLEMNMAFGRWFSPQLKTDSNAIIINESAAKAMGVSNPVGKKLYTIDNMQTGEMISYEVIGVVKNFHFESLRKNIGPLCFLLGRNTWAASFKVEAARIPSVLDRAENIWKSMVSSIPFSHQFMDESFNNMYRAETRVGKLALIFSVLAIFIACLGLFGLATFIAEQRTKEIGIRKVLGASVNGLIGLLSKDFIRLVLIAFCIAAPAAWFFMNKWLEDFAFRINISWWVFAIAGFLTIAIALLTVSFQAVRAALSNPVKSLRTE